MASLVDVSKTGLPANRAGSIRISVAKMTTSDCGDILLCEDSFLARRALRLNLDLMTQRSGNLLERLRRHYGVRYASRTGGDSNDFFHTERFRNCGFLRLDF